MRRKHDLDDQKDEFKEPKVVEEDFVLINRNEVAQAAKKQQSVFKLFKQKLLLLRIQRGIDNLDNYTSIDELLKLIAQYSEEGFDNTTMQS